MKNLILALSIVIAACQSVDLASPSAPVSMSIRAIDKSFQLYDYPSNWEAESHVDKAFARENGQSLEVVSHCNQTPGKFFKNIEVGDALAVTYSDGSTNYFIVSEFITVIYQKPSNPMAGSWMVGDVSYTPETFTAFIMRPNALVLHASICTVNFWYAPGQHIFIAYASAK